MLPVQKQHEKFEQNVSLEYRCNLLNEFLQKVGELVQSALNEELAALKDKANIQTLKNLLCFEEVFGPLISVTWLTRSRLLTGQPRAPHKATC